MKILATITETKPIDLGCELFISCLQPLSLIIIQKTDTHFTTPRRIEG